MTTGATQRLFQEGLAIYAVMAYGLLVWSVQTSNRLTAVLMVLCASPLLLAGLAVFVEWRPLGKLVNFGTNGWSFLIGDTFVLTTAVLMAALAWHAIPKSGWYMSWQWIVASLVIGFVAGLTFHWWDGMNYTRDGAEAALNSPTKLAHDLVAYPVLFGGLVCVGVPVFMYWSSYSWAFLGCLVFQLALMAADGIRGLRAFDMHPAWNVVTFTPLRGMST